MIGFGRYNAIGIGLAVYLRDHFSKNAMGINTQMNLMHQNSRKLAASSGRGMQQMGMGLGIMGAGILAFTGHAIKELAIFEKELSTIKAVADDNTLSMKDLEKEIRKVGITGVFSMDEIAKAASTLGRAGFTRKQIQETLQAASDLGAAGDIEVNAAADSIGRILNMFDLAANQSTHVADLLAISANKSATSISDLIESLKYSGDVLKALNIPMEESLAMFMKLGNAGLRGSMAGTSIANMLRYINKATTDFRTKRQTQAISLMGLNPEDLVDANGNMRSMVTIMDKLRESLSQMPTNKAQAIMEAMTGVRGQRALIPLLALTKNTKSMGDFLKMLKDPSLSGSAKRIAEGMMNNIWGDIEKLKDNWKSFQIEFARIPGLRTLIQGFTKLIGLVTKFVSTPIGKILGTAVVLFGAIALVAGTVLTIMGSLAFSVNQLGLTYARTGATSVVSLNAMTAATTRLTVATNAANMSSMGGWGSAGATGMGRMARNRGGQFIGKTQFMNMAGLVPLARNSTAAAGSIGKMAGPLGRLTPLLGSLGSGLGRLIPYVGLAIMAFQAFGAIAKLFSGDIGGGLSGLYKMSGIGMVADLMTNPNSGGLEGMINRSLGKEGNKNTEQTLGGKGNVRQINQEEWQTMMGGGQGNVNNSNEVIINIDGYPSIQKKIEDGNNEEVYQTLQ